ncbi:MAG: BrnT family toxin [Phascolarctobacterium sp.]|nr:BrnT family toxin [Phascolarctobacterium sp.]
MERKFDSITVYNYNIIIDELRFEWDENKNSINKRKHKVSFEEAKSVFEDVEALIIDDPEHSEQEERFIIMGFSSKARLLVVCHCYRANETIIRIISARKATERESMQYRAML